jgi:hypothetical protein
MITSVVGGAGTALAVGVIFDPPLGLAAGAGGAVVLASIIGWIIYADRLLDAAAAADEPLFPTPPDA